MSSISRNCASPLRAARLLADGPYTRGLKAWCAAFPDPIEDEYLSCGTSTFLGRANSRSDTTTSISTNGRNNQRIEFDLDLILRDESEKSTESIPVRSPVQRFPSQLPDRVRQPLPVAKGPAFRSSGSYVGLPPVDDSPPKRRLTAFSRAGRLPPLRESSSPIPEDFKYKLHPKSRSPLLQAWIRHHQLDIEIANPLPNLPPVPEVPVPRAPTPEQLSTMELAREQGWTRPGRPPIGWIPGEPLVPLEDWRCDRIDDGRWSTSEESSEEYSTQPGSTTFDETAIDDDVTESSDNLSESPVPESDSDDNGPSGSLPLSIPVPSVTFRSVPTNLVHHHHYTTSPPQPSPPGLLTRCWNWVKSFWT